MYILTLMSNNLVNQSTKAISTNELRWIGPVLDVVSSGPMDLFFTTRYNITLNPASKKTDLSFWFSDWQWYAAAYVTLDTEQLISHTRSAAGWYQLALYQGSDRWDYSSFRSARITYHDSWHSRQCHVLTQVSNTACILVCLFNSGFQTAS